MLRMSNLFLEGRRGQKVGRGYRKRRRQREINPESILSKVWLVRTKSIGTGPDVSVVGGGVCIRPNGLIVIAAHVLRLQYIHPSRGKLKVIGNDKKITVARGVNDVGFRSITVAQVFRQFDIAFCWVEKKTDDEVFDFVDLDQLGDVGVHRCDPLVAAVHHGLTPFATKVGWACFPLPAQVEFPVLTDVQTIRSSQTDYRARGMCHPCNWRTAGGCVDDDQKFLTHLHPRLPLLQVHGLESAEGQGGCPIFSSTSGKFVGLFSFALSSYEYMIPSSFIRHVASSLNLW